MVGLPLLVLEPADGAVLPGERRRVALRTARARTAVRLAQRGDGRLALLAFNPARRREGEAPDVEAERLLPVGTACALLRCEVAGDGGFAAVRGLRRVEVVGAASGGCCDADDPRAEGTQAVCLPLDAAIDGDDEARFAALLASLRALDLPVGRLPPGPLEARIDRVARGLALAPWVQAEVLAAPALAIRIRRLADAAQEIAAPGSSFRPDEGDAPYRDDEEHLEDLVRLWEARAGAQSAGGVAEADRHLALVRGDAIRRRRRAAALRARAALARIERRLAASRRAGVVPVLEGIRAAHGLDARGVDALLAAGLAGHARFGDRVRRAARLLPPAELPLDAWIAALEAGAFPSG